MNHPKTNKTFHKPIYCRAKANTSMEWSRIELLEGYTSPAHAQLIQQIQYKKFNEELSAQQKDFPDDDNDDNDQSKDSRDTQYSLFYKEDDADFYDAAHNDCRYDDYNNYENNNCDDDADNNDDDDDDSCASSYSFMDELKLLTKQVVYRIIHHSFQAIK